jgi:predicted metal-dependent enzyme (double-stranded beta helix superfamily)
MNKLRRKALSLLVGLLASMLAGAIFKRLWRFTPGPDEAPEATDERRGWGEILLAAALQGAIFSLIKAAFDRAAAEGVRQVTGDWPGEEGEPSAEE